MTTSHPEPLSFPSPWFSAGSPSPFDIAGIAAELDRAAASLSAAERGSLTIKLNQDGFGTGLVVRGPLNTKAVATITKPRAGRWGWSVGGRIAFLAGLAPGSEEVVPKLKAKVPVRVAPEVRGLYRLFRKFGHGRIVAAVRAVRVAQGVEVRI